MEARHLNPSAEQKDNDVLPGPSKQNLKNPVHYNVILVGNTRAGKSASGNTILGRTAFISKKSSNATTQEVQKESVTFEGVTLDVYDTPGFSDPERSHEDIVEKLQPLLQLDPSVPLVFLLVMKADRFTPEEKQTLEMIEDWVPEWLFQNIWILFTRGDELESEGLSIEEFIKDTEELSKVIKSFKDRYHVFNNRKHDPDQVRRLIEKLKNGSLSLAPELRQKTPPDPERDPLRMVLLGKTGVGKSAAGNTILREKNRFRSECSFSSITAVCERQQAEVEGRNVCVVDTPGLFDLAVEIGWSVYLSSPGPHTFLYVLPINTTFTEQEEEVIQKLEQIFGEEMRKHTIMLFTHGDALEGESVDELINQNVSLSRLVDQCGGRYHLFNNKDLRNRAQVTQLLGKIDRMLDQNGGTCYSNEMFEDAERCRLEEEERRKQEEEDRKQRDEEQKQEESERVKKETRKKIRRETEMERFSRETEEKVKKESKELCDQINNRIREEMSFRKYLWRKIKLLVIGAVIGAGIGAGIGGIGSEALIKYDFTFNLLAGVGLLAGCGLFVGAAFGAALAYTKRQNDEDKIENTIMDELQKMNEDTKKTIMEEVKKKKEDREKTLLKTEKEMETKISQELEEERKETEKTITEEMEKVRIEIEKKIKEEMEKVRIEIEKKIQTEGEEMKGDGGKKIKEEVKKMKKERDENIKELLKEMRDREGEIRGKKIKEMKTEKRRRMREEMENMIEKEMENMIEKEMENMIEKEMENMKKEIDERIKEEIGNVEKMITERIEEEMNTKVKREIKNGSDSTALLN